VIVDLQAQHARQGVQVGERIASRLRAGQGVGGARLAPKRKPDGQSLGGSLPAVIASTPVEADQTGFALRFGELVERFQAGGPNQPGRPIVGLTLAESTQFAREDAELAARQITRRLRSGS
jgi:hypothetical protein